MTANLAMWRKSLTQSVKIATRPEWDALDLLSKWFIATRASISTLSFHSCLIGGLLAWGHLASTGGRMDLPVWIVMTVGLFVAHGASNLINDYVDFSRGVDSDNYFRTHYTTHPLLQGFMSKRKHAVYFWVSSAIAVASGLYAWHYSGYSSVVFWLFVAGAAILALYTWPLKHIGLGEVSIFLIWGPLMIMGVYYVLAGSWSWNAVLATLPFGLSVGAANNAEHLDKRVEDARKGVHTLPVLIGDVAARWVTIVAIVLCYLITIYLVFGNRYFTPAMLLVLLALTSTLPTIEHLLRPKPSEVPKDHPAWPMWFFADCLRFSAAFGNWFVVGLALDTLLRAFVPGFWR
ncbi:MAG: prenyltransferase [Burkholderiales bacterium]|nr:prenyltransferase [Burkholderiales bacterium]